MDADHALRTTRSVRRRIDFDRSVEAHVIEDCIRTAVQAPTGANPEAWRFLVISEPERKVALAQLYRRALDAYAAARPDAPPRASVRALAERLHEMPALILVCSWGRPALDSVAQQVAFYGSVLPAAWSLMVALRSRGIGATWTTLHLLHADEAARLLGIPEDVTQTVLLPIGYMREAKLRPASRREPHEVTYWNAWGVTRSR
jgi:nitroreductase